MVSDWKIGESSLLCLLLACLGLSCATACGREATPPTTPTPTTPTPTPSPSATLRATGTVVEIGGGPVPEASVGAFGCSSGASPLAQTLTDTTGGFSLALESAVGNIGCVFLRVQKAGYALEEVRGGLEGITVRLQRQRRVSGTIVEIDGGPVHGVNISTSGSSLATVLSGANGSFVIDGVAKYMNLVKEDFASRFIEVPAGQDVDLGTVHFQRRIVVKNGSRVVSRLSAADVDYDFYDMWDNEVWCIPCKRIELDSEQQELVVELQWSAATPLQLWASTDSANTAATDRAKPGESALTLRVSAATRVLLVGVPSPTRSPQPLQQPVNFELSINLP